MSNFHTTVRVKTYVVQKAGERLDQEGLPYSLGWVVERLLNQWLSGSLNVEKI